MSAQIVVELNGEEITRLPLDNPQTVIGRDPKADIHLDNRALSRRHAQVEKRGASIWISDLGSQNGTYINGERIDEPRPLNGGDVIELGRYRVHLEGVEEVGGETPVLTVTGPEGRHRFLMVDREVIIGRSPSCDISIGHKSISRRHLRISQDGNCFIAEDLGSQNGTRLHDERIQGPTRFQVGDVLQMSDFEIELGYLEDAMDGTAGGEERGNKTMMIDRSELAKAADLGGDFELKSAAGKLAFMDRSGGGGPSSSQVQPRASREPPEPKEKWDNFPFEPSEQHTAAPSAPPPRQRTPPPAPPPPAPEPEPAYVDELQISHPDIAPTSVPLDDAITVIGEDGSVGPAHTGATFAAQAHLVFVRGDDGVVVTAAGDRRVLTVNGTPRLVATLNDGDTVEFDLLTVVFRAD